MTMENWMKKKKQSYQSQYLNKKIMYEIIIFFFQANETGFIRFVGQADS